MSKRSVHPLGEMIKEAIKKTGIAQAKVAERMNVPRQTINQIDLRKSFDLEFLQKLKNATGIDFTDYVFDPKEKRYVSINNISKVSEPKTEYTKETNVVELMLTVKISTEEDDLTKLSGLIASFKGEAKKHGFTLK
jgi:transcriptional regulator with XRE-family HTH domain